MQSCGAGCDHDSCDRGAVDNLYSHINVELSKVLNGVPFGDPSLLKRPPMANIIKPYHLRNQHTVGIQVEEDEDEDEDILILQISLTASIKLKHIALLSDVEQRSATEMRIIINKPEATWQELVSMSPTQQWPLVTATSVQNQVLDYQTRIARFSQVTHVTLLFTRSRTENSTFPFRIFYVGLHGSVERLLTDTRIVNAVYEARPMLEDHSLPNDLITRAHLGQ